MQTGLIALLGLASLFIGWILTFILPELRSVSWGIIALGAVLILLALIVDYRRVGKVIISRQGRFGTGATVMVSVFIGIILLVNAISYANYQQWDVTGLSQYVLTSQTKEALANLDQEVEVIKFFVPDDPYGCATYATSLLDKYAIYTDKLNVREIDPEEHPEEARKYNVQQYQSVVFVGEYGERLVYPIYILLEAEHAFTSAILEVTGTVQKVAYFTTGHGEVDIYSTAATGYSTANQGLRDNLYKTATIELLASGTVPDDAAVLIIAAPQERLSDAEIDIVQDYLDRDGRLIILVNPDSPEGFDRLLQPWGLKVEQGFIWESGNSFAAPSRDSPLVPSLRNYFEFTAIYFPGATCISTPLEGYVRANLGTEEEPHYVWLGEDKNIMLVSLAVTSQESWLENSGSSVDPEFDEDVDIKGPLNLGYFVTAVRIDTSEGTHTPVPYGPRLLVIGDSDFATNKHLLNGNNSDLFLNSIEWLTFGTELISIDRKILQARRFLISAGESRFITISSIGLLPLLLLVAGVIVWWRRR
ncbi:MAG TPA: GldG family protein [Dehalococcoidia bacterium]|nr:GldG family protein [Dehalococcoidia bacterium]